MPERFLPDEPFPPYSYVPGKFPHPIRDPSGYSYGKEDPSTDVPDSIAWQECRVYLRGIDLFNAGYYWEAHEAWEQAWHACGRTGRDADFFKGLIKLAAAGVKAREANTAGAVRHARRAHQLLNGVAEALAIDETSVRHFGLNLVEVVTFAGNLVKDSTVLLPSGPAFSLMPTAET
ncbi:MAG: DUF309 domain-containing protein [Pirellulales bacterium]|nr:DUF309 domain-containing protein [Pirellulales bacterium]